MQKFVLVVLVTVFAACVARPLDQTDVDASSTVGVPYNEEIVVESSLSIRPKDQTRQKRQFGPYGQSSALANANSYGQYSGPGGFGASSGIAGAQAFQSQGPLGGFGASATNAGTQGFHAGPGGISGSAGQSGTQTYNLPGGRNVNVAYGGTFGASNGQLTGGSSHGVTYSKK